MTIEITSPELEALIELRLRSGAYRNPEDVILQTLRDSAPATRTAADLIAAMPASPYKEIDLEPTREVQPFAMRRCNGLAGGYQRTLGTAAAKARAKGAVFHRETANRRTLRQRDNRHFEKARVPALNPWVSG